jgi:oligoendopeptidase F
MIDNKVEWDLTDLYSGIQDERIESDLNGLLKRAAEFEAGYRGKIDNPALDAATLVAGIEEYESILQEMEKPADFASLMFAADTSDPERGAFLQSIRERCTEITVRLIFFDLELMAVPESRISEVLDSPVLNKYRHYIGALRLARDYQLSEPEEKILEETANTGRRAFTRLFEESLSGICFELKTDEESKMLTLPEILALQRDPDREVRKAASAALTKGLVENQRVFALIFNTLIQDKATNDRLRGHAYPEEARHISNELDREIVELVVRTAIENYGVVSRYYQLKREILGFEKLTHYDRYAPIFSSEKEIPFDHAKEIVLNAFGEFSPVMRDVAQLFFDRSWIDAAVRKGKRGGAFCSYVTPDLHPYVFLSYLNKIDDVSTLGHELGHGVHAYLAREHGYLSFASVLPLAELASTFGEMLVFESLQAESSPEDKLALYAGKIESTFATIFRQAAMFRFEQAIHEHRRTKGELTVEDYSGYWQSEQSAMFGDSVELGDEHRFWWMYVSHFISSPFYVYAYTFGELLVLALYAKYRKEGMSFVPKFVEMLKVGGSMSPEETLSGVGIDIRDQKFWQGGIDVLSDLIDRFEVLYRDWAKQ